MHLILWRHAEAEDIAPNDLSRALTPRGQRQAAKMAAWLHAQLGDSIKDWRLIASPAVRAQQTASALDLTVETVNAIAPDAEPNAILAAAQWPDGTRDVIVTGHQPTLGRVAALLLHGAEGDVSVKKGAMWWFETREREGRREVRLKAMVVPEHV